MTTAIAAPRGRRRVPAHTDSASGLRRRHWNVAPETARRRRRETKSANPRQPQVPDDRVIAGVNVRPEISPSRRWARIAECRAARAQGTMDPPREPARRSGDDTRRQEERPGGVRARSTPNRRMGLASAPLRSKSADVVPDVSRGGGGTWPAPGWPRGDAVGGADGRFESGWIAAATRRGALDEARPG